MSAMGGASAQFIKNQKQRSYPRTYRRLMLRKLSDTYEFMTYDELIRAFHNYWLAFLYVAQDPQQRVFVVNWQTNEKDEKLQKKFNDLFTQFLKIYGYAPQDVKCQVCEKVICLSNDKDKKEKCKQHARERGHREFIDPYTFLELRTRDKPDAASGKVAIGRRVNFMKVWGKYRHEILIHKIGYYVNDVVMNSSGFPTPVKVAMVNPDDPSLFKYFTYWVPYPYWEEQHRKVVALLVSVIIQLEDIIREYLHKERQQQGKPADGQQGAISTAPTLEDGDLEDDEEVNEFEDDEQGEET